MLEKEVAPRFYSSDNAPAKRGLYPRPHCSWLSETEGSRGVPMYGELQAMWRLERGGKRRTELQYCTEVECAGGRDAWLLLSFYSLFSKR